MFAPSWCISRTWGLAQMLRSSNYSSVVQSLLSRHTSTAPSPRNFDLFVSATCERFGSLGSPPSRLFFGPDCCLRAPPPGSASTVWFLLINATIPRCPSTKYNDGDSKSLQLQTCSSDEAISPHYPPLLPFFPSPDPLRQDTPRQGHAPGDFPALRGGGGGGD